ncbi:uncharacterized protein LOC120276779 [Dioscorea cayenensis subsp. rotundata]|uniref:Uncharacterized protein LOC120276779 n=1 Tax=Dioscorea cayennensis subsp. rotundata TaxID=55577 RepID=A0AB40CHD2_DIOCR|nr:uncharacterized protein LOC120276779 [Dioscorea cayenensis subsp. rotundata]
MAAALWDSGGGEEFSPSATVVPFDQPVPLLRGPVPAGPEDDPSVGPFVLAFKDAASWRSALEATRSKLIEQCQAGARVGCAITASNKCKPPWWKSLIGYTKADFAERERCEEQEMAACVAASKEACVSFSNEKCLPVFRDARIACKSWEGVYLVYAPAEHANLKPNCEQEENSSDSSESNSESTNYRASVLMENFTCILENVQK